MHRVPAGSAASLVAVKHTAYNSMLQQLRLQAASVLEHGACAICGAAQRTCCL